MQSRGYTEPMEIKLKLTQIWHEDGQTQADMTCYYAFTLCILRKRSILLSEFNPIYILTPYFSKI
jgi:hypothetical protein